MVQSYLNTSYKIDTATELKAFAYKKAFPIFIEKTFIYLNKQFSICGHIHPLHQVPAAPLPRALALYLCHSHILSDLI